MSINQSLPINRKRNVTALSLKQMLRRTNSSLKLRLSCKIDSDYGESLEADDCDTTSTSSTPTSRLSEAESSDDQSNSVPSSNQSSTDDVPSASTRHHHTYQASGITANSHHNSDQTFNQTQLHHHPCLSTKSHNSGGANGNAKRKIHFAKTVRVCLIPARCEYTHIYSDLWWTVKECESFKKDAYFELKEFIEVNRCSVKDGMFVIYQPTEAEEAEFHYIVNNNSNNNNSSNNHNSNHNNNHNNNISNNSNSAFNNSNEDTMIQQEAAADSTLYSALDKWSSDIISPSSSPHQHEKESSTSSSSSSHSSTTSCTLKMSNVSINSSCAAYQNPTRVFNNGCSGNNNGNFSPSYSTNSNSSR